MVCVVKIIASSLALLVVLSCSAATAEVPAMIAEASNSPDGVNVAWTAPPVSADQFTIQRSHSGGLFTTIATVDGATYGYMDAGGTTADAYIVLAFVDGKVAFSSNPAVATLDPHCPIIWLDDEFPFFGIDPSCIWRG